VLVTAPDELRARFRGLGGERLAETLTRRRARKGEEAVLGAVLRRLARRVRELTHEIDQLDAQLEAIVKRLAPELLAESGVGPVCAAQLVVSSGDPTRMASEASFAALAGTSPVEASSGHQQRHRLNRGGDRQLNRALHVISLTRVRWHAKTAAHHRTLLASGKTPREARRCVKRMLARYFHHRPQAIPALALTP
jgi:transposase